MKVNKNTVKVNKKWWGNETIQSKLKPTQNHNSKQKSKLQLPPLPALLKVQNERHWIILSSYAKPLHIQCEETWLCSQWKTVQNVYTYKQEVWETLHTALFPATKLLTNSKSAVGTKVN